MPLRRQARVVAALLPASRWCAAAESISRVHGAIAQVTGGNRRLTHAFMFDFWLRELTLIGPFPIPWRNAGDSALREAASDRTMMFCSFHAPLVEMTLTAGVQLGYEPPIMVADAGMLVDGNKFVAPGLERRLDAMKAGPRSLRPVLEQLRAGRSVAWLADVTVGGEISGQLLRLVKLSGARLVFSWAERDPDGMISVRYLNPPFPYCEDEAAIEANVAVLRKERNRILGQLGFPLSPPQL